MFILCGTLEIGSIIYELPEQYKKDNTGWEQLFHIVKNKNEAVDCLVESECNVVDMMISEGKAQGHYDVQHCTFTLCWKSLGGGNYETYVLWGINKTFYSNDEFMDYCQVSDKVFKENWDIVDKWINEYGYY